MKSLLCNLKEDIVFTIRKHAGEDDEDNDVFTHEEVTIHNALIAPSTSENSLTVTNPEKIVADVVVYLPKSAPHVELRGATAVIPRYPNYQFRVQGTPMAYKDTPTAYDTAVRLIRIDG